MPLDLLEYRVFQNQVVAGTAATAEIDLPAPVPSGETWRVDRIAAMVLLPGELNDVFVVGQPIVFVYDQVNPAPTALPVDSTVLLTYPTTGQANPPPIASKNTIYFIDADDLSSPITLLAGFQLGLVFAVPWGNTGTTWTASARIQYSRFAGTGGVPQPFAGAIGVPIPAGL